MVAGRLKNQISCKVIFKGYTRRSIFSTLFERCICNIFRGYIRADVTVVDPLGFRSGLPDGKWNVANLAISDPLLAVD